MKKIHGVMVMFTVIFIFSASICFSEQGVGAGKAVFRYAFLASDNEGNAATIDYRQRITDMQTGERIRVYMEPVTSVYIYLVHVSSGGELSLLFPAAFGFFSEDYETGATYYLPSEDRWYILKDPPGIEEFHLIVSTTRLPDLESLLDDYLELMYDNRHETDTADARQDVLDEIRHLAKRGNMLAGKNLKPVPIAGVVRAFDERPVSGVEARFTDVYATTIRIRH
ncbi:MAG: DUF4384 domain-containing protein [Spirochaetales bacterium]|nr:DUF4384 domain-containing protein [Spirochaetales bacterium]